MLQFANRIALRTPSLPSSLARGGVVPLSQQPFAARRKTPLIRAGQGQGRLIDEFVRSRALVLGLGNLFAVATIATTSSTAVGVTMAAATSHSSPAGTAPASSPTLSFDIAGRKIPLVGAPGMPESHVQKAMESQVFKHWVSRMTGPKGLLASGGGSGGSKSKCVLKQVVIQDVDFFGTRVGFVKFKAEVVDEASGAKLPGIVFGRGGAVGVLMLLESSDGGDGEKYAVLTEQGRVPVGRTLLELPAGMLDSDDPEGGGFVGTAAREIEEETGIKIRGSDLVELTALLDDSTGGKMLPSAGGSDEEMTLFLYRGRVAQERIRALQGAETGLRDHGELINVHVVPYKSLWRVTADAKALAAIALYEMALREGVLPPAPNAPELSNI